MTWWLWRQAASQKLRQKFRNDRVEEAVLGDRGRFITGMVVVFVYFCGQLEFGTWDSPIDSPKKNEIEQTETLF